MRISKSITIFAAGLLAGLTVHFLPSAAVSAFEQHGGHAQAKDTVQAVTGGMRVSAALSPGCPGDINNDGVVNIDDLTVVILGWGPCPVADSDGDGVPDNMDNCPFVANANQADLDNDGVGDVCDNCPMNANPSQQDSNNNGIGDACDSQLDADNDGVLDFMDNCPFTFNPGQEDFDADGVGDVCDNCPVIPNPLQEDVNMNGIGDVCESSLDNDGDGFSPQQGDCDDTNPNVNPIHPEICGNLIDDDCDGLVDEGCP